MKLLPSLYYSICTFLYLLPYVITKNCLHYSVWSEIKLAFNRRFTINNGFLSGDLYDKGTSLKAFHLSNYFFQPIISFACRCVLRLLCFLLIVTLEALDMIKENNLLCNGNDISIQSIGCSVKGRITSRENVS